MVFLAMYHDVFAAKFYGASAILERPNYHGRTKGKCVVGHKYEKSSIKKPKANISASIMLDVLAPG